MSPQGDIEYAPAEMKKNGTTVIHLATCMVVGYPPCTRIDFFRWLSWSSIASLSSSDPIPQKYSKIHDALGSWQSLLWQELTKPTLATEEIRLAYD